MEAVKVLEIQQSDILRLEAAMNNLWGDLNTSNVSNTARQEIENKLARCEENFKMALSGQASFKDLEQTIHECDRELAYAAVKQAENEISKSEHTASAFLALETVNRELNEGHLTPVRARHEVKAISRRHS